MRKELEAFREIMKRENIDLYIVMNADDHISEYADPYFASMEYISGFTGNDGTLVITSDEANLWTDGRYFIQAAIELKDSGIALMKEGEPGVPEINRWIIENTPANGCIGFDGRCISYSKVDELRKKLRSKSISFKTDKDYVDFLWHESRPEKAANKVWILEEKYAGRSIEEKLIDVKQYLLDNGADATVISAMDEIAWLTNMRGDDVPFNPVFDSFFLLTKHIRRLYISEKHLNEEIKSYLTANGIDVCYSTEQVYKDVQSLNANTILVDPLSTSFRMINCINNSNEIIYLGSPTSVLKCKKNSVECGNLEKAQLKDSIACTKYMCWFKESLLNGTEMTELSTAHKLHEFRAEQENFLGDSFETISAYGENAALCHYRTKSDNDVKIGKKGLYLVDSGGHYFEGSTDITRTWSCGKVTEEEKKAYTLTAIANLRLASQVFPDNVSSLVIDLSSREVFWKNGLDYNHGTGHGVGYLLNVHEEPVHFRYRCSKEAYLNIMSEGVYISDEPGFYSEGKFGVRLENMLLVQKAFINEHHSFLKFKTLTYVPFDNECIDPFYMNEEDLERYNAYHQSVYNKISPFLSESEAKWLKNACKPLNKLGNN